MHNRSKNRGNRALSEQPVLVEARPTYRIITLNRPDRLNTIVPPMPDEFEAVMANYRRPNLSHQAQSCLRVACRSAAPTTQ